MTENELAFREKLNSLYSSSVIPAMYLYPDGSLFYANKICMLLYGRAFIEKGFASLVEGDWNEIVNEAIDEMLPREISFKSGNYFINGVISPLKEKDGRVYICVKTGRTSSPDQPLENTFLFDTAQSAFRTYVEDVADVVDIHIRRLNGILGEDHPVSASIADTFSKIKERQQPLKDILYVTEKLNEAERSSVCLKDTVDEIARITGCVRILPSDVIGEKHIIVKGSPVLMTAAFTDIVTKLLPYTDCGKVCVKVSVENGQAAVVFSIAEPNVKQSGRYIYTLDGDIYNENIESAYRLIKSDGGSIISRLSPLGVETVCLFPLEKLSLRYSLSLQRKATDHTVVINAVRALKNLKLRLKNM